MSEADARVFLLDPADVERYVVFRQRMLNEAPWAFAASPSADITSQADTLRELLSGEQNVLVVAEDAPGGSLIAGAGVVGHRHEKMAHRAKIWGVFVDRSWRGRGLGERVMRRAIGVAKGWEGVDSVSLSVSANAPEARRLYERLGFVRWGTEPAALRLGDEVYDEDHMVLHFDGAPRDG